jgi:hypothetical protein
MSVKIKVGSNQSPSPVPNSPGVKINIVPETLKISLKARQTLDGKIMILDHLHMDIVLDVGGNKITTFPKDQITEEVYGSQNNYFKFLIREGVILPDSVRSGNVFGSLESLYPESANEGVSSEQVVLLATKKFLEQVTPALEAQEYIENEIEDHLIDPNPSDSTELGEVPEEPKKGSITPARIRRYLSGYGYY